MAHVNERLGEVPCPWCKAAMVVRLNPAGTITTNCSGSAGCDYSGFAKKGTKAARIITASQAGDDKPAPAAPGAPPPPPPPPPPKPAGRVPFTLESLR